MAGGIHAEALQMIRRQRNAEVFTGREFVEPLEGVGRVDEVAGMILDGNGNTGGFGGGKMGLHQFDKFFDLRLQFSAFQTGFTTPAADHNLGAEFLGEGHFLLQPERPEIVARDAAHAQDALGGLLTAQHFGECLVAHGLDLLALIAVHAGPDVDGVSAGLGHFRKDFLERQRAVHRRRQTVIEPKLWPGRQCRARREGDGGGGEKLASVDLFHGGQRVRDYQSFCEANRAPWARFSNFAQTMLG